mmetsp:Transcript_20931/g.64674  ORF Transcript_20931/g.64674 Transcript_20931/m.64674 type:complete len:246 (-) Transcript_20931:1718-2455(-)
MPSADTRCQVFGSIAATSPANEGCSSFEEDRRASRYVDGAKGRSGHSTSTYNVTRDSRAQSRSASAATSTASPSSVKSCFTGHCVQAKAQSSWASAGESNWSMRRATSPAPAPKSRGAATSAFANAHNASATSRALKSAKFFCASAAKARNASGAETPKVAKARKSITFSEGVVVVFAARARSTFRESGVSSSRARETARKRVASAFLPTGVSSRSTRASRRASGGVRISATALTVFASAFGASS